MRFLNQDWTPQQLQAAVERGSHQSSHTYLGFLESEMVDMIKKGYWIVLPYDAVKDIPGLRLSPIGVVPQRDRRPRTIVDYSFYYVNDDTDKQALPEAMQFGRALDRLLRTVWTADPTHGPVFLLKIDLSDGFYRVRLAPEDLAGLGVVFPIGNKEQPLVAFPLVLPMGWTESPPHFCATTETAVDIANGLFHWWHPPPHPLEPAAAPPIPRSERLTVSLPPPVPTKFSTLWTPPLPTPRKRLRRRRPLAYVDVFVDDEILVGQGTAARLNRMRRILMHVNDKIIRPNDDADAGRREAMSMSKFGKGDAAWATRKLVLGWILDTLALTIELPPHQRKRLLDTLNENRHRQRISVKDWHKLLGELRSMVLAIPGGQGLFSHLQLAFCTEDKKRLCLHKHVQDQLEDFYALATSVADRPTRLAELFPSDPSHLGACDASGLGMGGIWFHHSSTGLITPKAWRYEWPPDISAALVSDDNPNGTITNSDLELAGTIAHEAVLAQVVSLRDTTVATLCDNTPAVNWRRRGSVTTSGPAAPLLRHAALQRRHLRYCSLIDYIPGPANKLADIASRRFDLTNSLLLQLLQSHSPQPTGWELLTPDKHMISQLISALRQQRPGLRSVSAVNKPPPRSGPMSGFRSSSPAAPWTPTSPHSVIKSPRSWSSPHVFGTVGVQEAVTPSQLLTYVTSYTPSPRASPTWVSPTRATQALAKWTHV